MPSPLPDDAPAGPDTFDAAALAREAGTSVEAAEIVRASELVDLHLETLLTRRLWGWDLWSSHEHSLFRGWFFGHLDWPRIAGGGLKAALWSITTNPLGTAAQRWDGFLRALDELCAFVDESGGRLRLVRTASEYRAARNAGAHAVLVSIQGANALDAAPDGPASIPGRAVVAVTLVHLTSSRYGPTSSPLAGRGRDAPLTTHGRELVEQLDAARIFVDLAHIGPRAFRDAVEVHDPTLPLLVTHTGVAGVKPHWRNVSDEQIRAVADTGGVVGVIFARAFLRGRNAPDDASLVVAHLEHIVDVGGEACAALGSDYDGAIVPPPDLRDGRLGYVRVVQAMLDRNWPRPRIEAVLGRNFLRCLEMLRP